ncbi:MAG TPA: hypothetical protein VNA44_03725 [Burkholderiaceae bacterium]|nr:hypothetical protein [Burkholderiaceae bacterium]
MSQLRHFERPHFYAGRLLTAADLQDEQEYFRAKLRLHNRLLHGWGVVTGLQVSESAGTLTVSAGLALDCAGNELVLAEAKHIALSNVGGRQYVTIQYVEVPTRQQPSTNGEAQFSTIREDVRIEITSTDPASGHGSAINSACDIDHPLCLATISRNGSKWRIAIKRRRLSK